MLQKSLAALAAAVVIVTAASVLPADAAKKQRQSEYQYQSDASSLDGRATGRPRTCGYATYLYDYRGVPMGPYCH
jgi:hypothetical protein